MKHPRTQTRLKAVDLFAGTGWGVACKALGIDEVGVEKMPEARATREANGMRNWLDDVWEVLETAPVDSPEFKAALLIASPPCQTFSMAGTGAGRKALDEVIGLIDSRAYFDVAKLREFGERHDMRTALVLTPLTYVAHHIPTYVVLEQVPTVLPVWERIAVELREWGYSVVTGVLNAEQYGVPQTRKRAILIARADGVEARMPTPTHSRYYDRNPTKLDDGVPPWVSMAEALGWGEDLGHQERHRGAGMLERHGDRATRPTDEPAATVTSGSRSASWRTKFNDQTGTAFDEEWPDKRPALTVATRDIVPNPGHNKSRHDDATKSRNDGIKVTVAEASALQSYPADFEWAPVIPVLRNGVDTGRVAPMSKTKAFLQIGNAVPPLLAQHVLSTIIDDMEG